MTKIKPRKNTPRLRFPEFKEELEEHKGKELFQNRREKGNETLPIFSVTLDRGLVPRKSLDRKTDDVAEPGDNLGVKSGDIVYNMMRMWQGAFGLAMQDCMVSPAYVALIPSKNLNADFIVQMFSRNRSLYLFTSYSYGLTSDRLRLYFKDFAAIKFSIPTLPEQQKIADFLSTVDRKIEQLVRKRELLEKYKKGVMQKIFSQKLRFKDEKGKSFPKWEEKKLGEVAESASYGMNAAGKEYDGENKYIRITDIDDKSRKYTSQVSPDGPLENQYLLQGGDILFARTGASVGKTYLYKKSDGKVYFAGFLIKFSIKKHVPYFIYSQTLTSDYDKWIKIFSMRSGQPGINSEEYKQLPLQLPSLPEQEKIADFLSVLDLKIESVTAHIEKSQKFKKGLLQQMFV